jgi:hypothetical protein
LLDESSMRQLLLLERRHWMAVATTLVVGGGTGEGTESDTSAVSECRLTLHHAVRLITESGQCPVAFRRAVQETGRFLYRGEAVTTSPTILRPTPDLLEAATYGEDDPDALRFFTCLEERFSSKEESSRVRPSRGHIGTARKQEAALWGSPCSVWPLEEAPDEGTVPGDDSFGYMWPQSTSLFYPGSTCEDDFVVNRGLPEALANEKEILFTSSSFLVVPEKYESLLRQRLGLKDTPVV